MTLEPTLQCYVFWYHCGNKQTIKGIAYYADLYLINNCGVLCTTNS